MSEQKVEVIKDGDGRERVEPVETDKGLPKKIVKTPKKITKHRQKVKGSNGKPLNINMKDYGRKDKEVAPPEEEKDETKGEDESKEVTKASVTDSGIESMASDNSKESMACATGAGAGGSGDTKKIKTVRTPKKKAKA